MLAILLLILIENVWSWMQEISLRDFQQHSEELVQLGIKQSAFASQIAINRNDGELLEAIARQLAGDPMIASVHIYDRYGMPLTSIESTAPEPAEQTQLILVEPIMAEEQTLGYVEARVVRQNLLKAPQKTYQFLTYYGQFLLFFAVLAGIFATTTFNRLRYRNKV